MMVADREKGKPVVESFAGSRRVVVGVVFLRSCFRLKSVQSREEVLDVCGKLVARDIFRRPSQRSADAREEVDVLDACGVL